MRARAHQRLETTIRAVGIVATMGFPTLAVSASLDGSGPLICAVTDTMSCDAQGDCVRGPATAVNLPVFLKVLIADKSVESTTQSGEQRTSKILSVNQEDGTTVIVGAEQGLGWSATIEQESGRLTVTASKEGMGYIVFGACMPQ